MRERICVTVGCGVAARPDEIRCKDCRQMVIDEMKKSGYLQPVPWQCYDGRTGDQKENTYETKNGINR